MFKTVKDYDGRSMIRPKSVLEGVSSCTRFSAVKLNSKTWPHRRNPCNTTWCPLNNLKEKRHGSRGMSLPLKKENWRQRKKKACRKHVWKQIHEKGMDVQIKYLTRVVGTVNESLICFTNIRKLGLSTAKIWSKYLQILLKKLISVCLYIIRFSLINWVSWRYRQLSGFNKRF